ncbi:MAG TPA: hypothetical protein VGI81_13120 [Tepidisphaeraceae bacterium]|jgi:hypothetical protein
MSYLRSLLKRLFRRRQQPPPVPHRRSFIEGLESRDMFSVAPQVTDVHLTGTVRAVTSVVLSFDQPLDPTSAQSIQAYQFGRIVPANSSDSSGISLGNILGGLLGLAKPKTPLIKNYKVQFTSVTYDDPTRTVTLTPVRAFNAVTWFRILRVFGTGTNAVMDPSGDPLNGGSNTYVHWFPYIGKTFTYRDDDNDMVTLRLKGPGQMFVFLQTNTDHAPIVFINGGTAKSVLTGRVIQSQIGDGVAIIPEVQGVGTVQTDLTTNGMFDVLSTEP